MNPTGALIYLIGTVTDLYVTAILLRLLLQWVRADFYNPISQFLIKITNPVLVPARRIIPSIGKLDTASVVIMLLLELLQLAVINLIRHADYGPEFLFFVCHTEITAHIIIDLLCFAYCQDHHQLGGESVAAPLDPPDPPTD